MNAKSEDALEVIKKEAVKAFQPVAEKELLKVKKLAEQSLKKLESYARKNPEKTTLMTAAVGAALGAALAVFLKTEVESKKK